MARGINGNVKAAGDLVKPSNFDEVVSASCKESGYERQIHGTYSNALRTGFAMEGLAVSIRIRYLTAGWQEKVTEVDDFFGLRKSAILIRNDITGGKNMFINTVPLSR